MSIAATAPAAPVGDVAGFPQDSATSASLFDQMTHRARQSPEAAGLEQVAQAAFDKLDGFIERANTSRHRADAVGQAPMSPSGETSAVGAAGDRADQAMQSMRAMFDHSIETQLVVRAATQLTGAATTLVRGQ